MSEATGGRRVEGCRLSVGDDAASSAVEAVRSSQAVAVHFDADKIAAIRTEATRRHEAMSGRNLAYGQSTPNQQMAGALGEAAVLVWLYETLPATFEFHGDEPGGADAYVRNPADGNGLTLIEVKAHDANFWSQNGRLVNAEQLSRMPADVIVWCVLPSPIGERVVIAGWSPATEARDSGVPEMTGKLSNVRIHAPLRTPGQLSEWLTSGRDAGWPGAI